MEKKIYTSIGLMSGTSMDGIDLALIVSDGKNIIERQKFLYSPYNDDFKNALRYLIYERPSLNEIKAIETQFTLLNAQIINNFLQQNNIAANKIDVIGFHGHTIAHDPKQHFTWQMGNPHLLAFKTKINVVADFRSRDVALGGQGAPLVPIYHFHLFNKFELPLIALNIGGVSNITYLPTTNENDIQAFDLCYGNAPLDDLVKVQLKIDYDNNGQIASSGVVNIGFAKQILQNEIFYKAPPKSFDRNDFAKYFRGIENLPIQDALATLAYVHAEVLRINIEYLGQNHNQLHQILLCGGGRKNAALTHYMKKALPNVKINLVDDLGYNGDAIEAEAFAFLAIRHLLDLPLSFQKTTGVLPADNYVPALPQQCFSSCGGVFYRA